MVPVCSSFSGLNHLRTNHPGSLSPPELGTSYGALHGSNHWRTPSFGSSSWGYCFTPHSYPVFGLVKAVWGYKESTSWFVVPPSNDALPRHSTFSIPAIMSTKKQQPSYATRSMYYGWVPQHREIHNAFVKHHLVATRPMEGISYDPQNPHVKAFIDAIRNSAIMTPLSNAMFDQRKIYSTKVRQNKFYESHRTAN